MKVQDYEKAILSLILRNPVSEKRIPQRICSELDADKFSEKQNKIIYGVIQEMVMTKKTPSVGNVIPFLQDRLDSVGGETYLVTLHKFLDVIKTPEGDGWETWVRLIDNAGRLRHLGLVIDKYKKYYEDFEMLVSSVGDVDQFLRTFVEKISDGTKSLKSLYKPLSHYVDEELERIKIEEQGGVIDLVPTCLPSLYPFFVPRPGLGVISGISSMGKTQFSLMLALGSAIHMYENDLPGFVTINELETSGWRLNRRMACVLTGVDSRQLAAGQVEGEKLERYKNTLSYLKNLPIYIDDNPNITTSQLATSALALHLEKGPRVMGISDYIELFSDKATGSEEQRISSVVRELRKLGWETGSAEIILTQLNNSVLMTDSKIGGIGRARYSGAIGQAADWFIEVYNPVAMHRANIDFTIPDGMSEDMAYALVLKNKDYATGQVPFQWVPEYTRFVDSTLAPGKVFSF